MRTSAPDALASSRLVFEPGTRIMSPKVVKMTSGCKAIEIESSTRPSGITHTGHPGTVNHLDIRRKQVFYTVLENRVRMSAADLHELERHGSHLGDFVRESASEIRLPIFIDELHLRISDGSND